MSSTYTAISKAKEEFKETFKRELNKTTESEFGIIFHVNRSIIRDIALFLHEKTDARFINMMILDAGEKFEIIYEYYLQFYEPNKYWFISTEVDKEANEIDSIEIIYPEARNYEKEISKRFGIKFLIFTEELSEELFVIPMHLNPENISETLTPFGIYNKIHNDNFYFFLQLEKRTNKILSVDQKSGWLYRGIVPLLLNKNAFTDNVELTKRIAGISSFHHSLAYVMGIEALANIKVNSRVNLIRTLLAELERVESHLLFFANLFLLLGYKKEYYNLLTQRNTLKKLYLQTFNAKFLDELNFIGYVKDISLENLKNNQAMLMEIIEGINDSIHHYLTKSYLLERCKGIGILTREEVREAGVIGPCLRASGINYDVRNEKPYLYYLDNELSQIWDVVSSDTGDVYGRIQTRAFEITNSNKIIKTTIEMLLKNTMTIEPVDVSKIKLPGNAFYFSQVESPQGELTYYLKTGDHPNLTTLGGCYICTPSLKNFTALRKYILKENNMSDFELIVHSMDIIWNEVDL